MKRLLKQTFFCVFSFLVLSAPKIYACGFDYVGSCATAVRFTANNVPKDYFASTCAYGNALSSSIGTNLTTLQLTTATTVSWESCTNILQESAVFYRIYNDPLSKGGFLKSVLAQQQLVNSPPYRTRTFGANLNIDLLAGLLPNTTYTIELYYQLSVDADGNGTIDATKVNNNNGLYYATTFQTGNINVNSGFPLTISTQNALCKGAVNGSASAVATGGTAPYTYAWSNGATGASIMGLQAGNYSVTATDATNAKGIKSFSITEPAPINVVLTTTNPSCGMGNGAITSSASGGNSTYTFLWNNNATTANLTSLSANVYSLTVTDSKGCIGSATTILTENCGNNNSYCTSASQAPWSEWIARVQLNTLDNTSLKSRPDRYAVGYSDWKDKATTLAQNGNYPLSITPGLSWSGAQTNLYFRVWIDFNKNGIFDDTEKVFERNATSQVVTAPISIPATALLGTSVMRVSMKKDAYPTACESFPAGEVEDYSIIITTGGPDPCLTDVTPPVLSACPQKITLTTLTTCATATWTAPTATDNCTATPSVNSTQNSSFCFPIGSTSVVYTATDARNNTSTCSFNVVVTLDNCATDAVPPVLSSCPQNISLTTASTCTTATWTAPTATDNCTTTPSVTGSKSSSFCFPIGSTSVVYTASDARNNTSTCSFNVVVTLDNCATDAIPPVLSACPQNISLTTASTCTTATWTAPTATDNCTTTPSVTGTKNSGFCFPIGSTSVVYTATDARNNTSTCSFNVVVAPVSTGTPDIGLTVTTPNVTYSNWTNISFKTTATNNSATAFSNVKIEFKFPTGTVNGGSPVFSSGTWEEWCIGGIQCFTWTIPSFAANGTATLDIPLFVLNITTPIVGTAKLLSSTPIDAITSNNTAIATINRNTSALQVNVRLKASQQIPVVIQKISPNPTEGDVLLNLESLDEREVQFNFSDAFGRIVKTEIRKVEKGQNRLQFDVGQLPQGIYLITPSTSLGKQMPRKFMKL
jgi:GEVED domain/HYR domain/SprB repeat/Domain of unknown function DUF11/Secretion system C-terminal sorting domain